MSARLHGAINIKVGVVETMAVERPQPAVRRIERGIKVSNNDRQVQQMSSAVQSDLIQDGSDDQNGQIDPARPDHRRVIAIDGAAAAGKTTVARDLADRLKATLFDTGVLYRTVTLAALDRGISPNDADDLAQLARTIKISVNRPSVADGRLYDVLLDGRDVTWAIRDADIDKNVSAVSAHRAVREALLPVQRSIADGAAVVIVGRDIGTIVTPSAGVKIFLLASLEERARRRHAELTARGLDQDMDFVRSDLARRDAIDIGRDISPLKAADDAISIDTDGRSIADVVAEIERYVNETWMAFT